jgi:ring-1,2-phenylacetyl-CoA epoxidase subunit PaaC
MDEVEQALLARGIAVDRAALLPVWQSNVSRVLSEATLERPADGYMQRGGRTGRHSESLGRMLAEMQVLARAHPDATW